MSDIIQDAKKLLEDTTPGPWVASDNGYIGNTSGVMIHDGQVLGDTTEDTNLIAAAPALAQALAEETWEYAVQIERSDGWEYTRKPWESRWLQNYDAQLKHVQRGFPGEKTRIMRRRVSPPEVCE